MEAQTAGTVGTVGTVPQRAASHPGATPVASPSDQTSWESQIGVDPIVGSGALNVETVIQVEKTTGEFF